MGGSNKGQSMTKHFYWWLVTSYNKREVIVKVNKKPMKFKIDSGAEITVISYHVFMELSSVCLPAS